MKEKLTNNLLLKLISLVIAFLIWVVVVNISNPEVSRSKTVPVTILNGNLLTDAGKTFSVVGGDTVTVNYKVRTRDAYRISEDDFQASVDMAELYNVTGSVPVMVEIVGNRELIIGTPSVRPGTLRVNTEELQNKSFSLTTRAVGTPAEGFSVGSMTVDPPAIMVSGPVSIVGRISSVGVETDVTGASGDLQGSAPITFYDANGNRFEISDKRLTTDPAEVSYSIHMLRGKTLALDFQSEGQAAPGYRFTGVECSVKSIGVVGERSILDSLDNLTVSGSALSVNNATSDKVVSIDLNNYLPSGVSIIGNADVQVTLKVEPLNTQAYQLSLGSGITVENRGEGYTYTLSPEIISVELSGLPEDLSAVKVEDLKAVLDVGGLELGLNPGTLDLTTPANTAIASVTPFTVIVSNMSDGPGAMLPLPTEASSSDAAAESSAAGQARNEEAGNDGTGTASHEAAGNDGAEPVRHAEAGAGGEGQLQHADAGHDAGEASPGHDGGRQSDM